MRKRRKLPESFASPEAAGRFWDRHSLADYWHETRPADVRIDIKDIRVVFEVNGQIAQQIRSLASRRKLAPSALLSRWVREGLHRENLR